MHKKWGIFLMALVCLISVLSLFSCNKQGESVAEDPPVINEQWSKELLNADQKGVTYTYSFNSVEELLFAIKHDPDKYNNASVKVIGTIYTEAATASLIDFTMNSTNSSNFVSSGGAWLQFRNTLKNSKNKINLTITNAAQDAVSETGDYVKVYGFVKLEKDNIHIVGEYDLIATVNERVQNINNQK